VTTTAPPNGAPATTTALTTAQNAQAYRDHVALAVSDAAGRIRLGHVALRLSEPDALAGWLEAVRRVAADHGVMLDATRPRRKR
jgi:hypothetical protein